MDVDGEESEERDDSESLEERERARFLSERWRYDADMGAVGLGMGVDDEDQIVIDDYEVE
jgi:enhancer of polycomb-like protein